MTYIIAYLATAAVFLLIDFVWLSYVARSFYREQLGSLLADPPNLTIAAGFYAVYAIGIVIFATSPALKSGRATDALIYGALFGFFAYATYDMTNLSTLKNWPVMMSVVDVIWGTVLTSTAATLGYLITRAFTA